MSNKKYFISFLILIFILSGCRKKENIKYIPIEEKDQKEETQTKTNRLNSSSEKNNNQTNKNSNQTSKKVFDVDISLPKINLTYPRDYNTTNSLITFNCSAKDFQSGLKRSKTVMWKRSQSSMATVMKEQHKH